MPRYGPFIHQVHIADGFADDCDELVHQCTKLENLNYQNFCDIWKRMKIGCLYTGRTLGAEIAELSEEVIQIAKHYMLKNTANFEESVAGLFIVYALLNLQPYPGFACLRIVPEDLPALDRIEVVARREKRHDVLYILGSLLIKGPVQYHASEREHGMDIAIRKYLEGFTSIDKLGVRPKGVFYRQNEELDIIRELDGITKRYTQAKMEISETAEFDRNLKYIDTNLPQHLQSTLKKLISGIYEEQYGYVATGDDGDKLMQKRKLIREKAMKALVQPVKHLMKLEDRKNAENAADSESPEKEPRNEWPEVPLEQPKETAGASPQTSNKEAIKTNLRTFFKKSLKALPKGTKKSPKSNLKGSPKVSPKGTPKGNLKATKVTPKSTPKRKRKVSQKVPQDVSPDSAEVDGKKKIKKDKVVKMPKNKKRRIPVSPRALKKSQSSELYDYDSYSESDSDSTDEEYETDPELDLENMSELREIRAQREEETNEENIDKETEDQTQEDNDVEEQELDIQIDTLPVFIRTEDQGKLYEIEIIDSMVEDELPEKREPPQHTYKKKQSAIMKINKMPDLSIKKIDEAQNTHTAVASTSKCNIDTDDLAKICEIKEELSDQKDKEGEEKTPGIPQVEKRDMKRVHLQSKMRRLGMLPMANFMASEDIEEQSEEETSEDEDNGVSPNVSLEAIEEP